MSLSDDKGQAFVFLINKAGKAWIFIVWAFGPVTGKLFYISTSNLNNQLWNAHTFRMKFCMHDLYINRCCNVSHLKTVIKTVVKLEDKRTVWPHWAIEDLHDWLQTVLHDTDSQHLSKQCFQIHFVIIIIVISVGEKNIWYCIQIYIAFELYTYYFISIKVLINKGPRSHIQ